MKKVVCFMAAIAMCMALTGCTDSSEGAMPVSSKYCHCVPDVYFKYNMFGGLDIDSSCMTDYGREIEVPFQLKLFIIERVFHYIKLSFRELRELVTQEGGAYKTIVGMYGLKPRHEIPLDLIYMEAAHQYKP